MSSPFCGYIRWAGHRSGRSRESITRISFLNKPVCPQSRSLGGLCRNDVGEFESCFSKQCPKLSLSALEAVFCWRRHDRGPDEHIKAGQDALQRKSLQDEPSLRTFDLQVARPKDRSVPVGSPSLRNNAARSEHLADTKTPAIQRGILQTRS